MLLNTLVVGKGLNILLDSDIAEVSKRILDESIQRLPRKGTAPNLLAQEADRDKKKLEWNQGYVDLLREEVKHTNLYCH
jgi:anion-transporting  ArsA/GET3 family ATPase